MEVYGDFRSSGTEAAKAIVAAAFLGKMGLTADDLESIKSQIPRLMNQDPEPQPEK